MDESVRAIAARQQEDYGPVRTVEPQEALEGLAGAEAFVASVDRYLSSHPGPP